jgi:hypothetical protein
MHKLVLVMRRTSRLVGMPKCECANTLDRAWNGRPTVKESVIPICGIIELKHRQFGAASKLSQTSQHNSSHQTVCRANPSSSSGSAQADNSKCPQISCSPQVFFLFYRISGTFSASFNCDWTPMPAQQLANFGPSPKRPNYGNSEYQDILAFSSSLTTSIHLVLLLNRKTFFERQTQRSWYRLTTQKRLSILA